MDTFGLVLVGLAVLVGLVGIVLPVLPGLLLVWGAVAVWALIVQGMTGWVVLGMATALVLASQVAKYVVPSRQLREAGIPRRSLLVGVAAGIVGFFVIPVVGLFLGFVGGMYAVERLRLGSHSTAWPSTRHALRAVGLTILIELVTGLLVTAGWLLAVIAG